MPANRKLREDFDGPWKLALTSQFELCISFFFPQIHADIDWSRKPEFLDKELRSITRGAKSKNRHADKLIKVHLKHGGERWILIQIEVQSQPDTHFAERIFIYHYRAYDLYKKEVVSLAILADESPEWRPQGFTYKNWDCGLSLQFPTVKLNDYRTHWTELERHANPFAYVLMAHLKTQETRHDFDARGKFKIALTRSLYRRGFKKIDIEAIYFIIDWFMVLPDNLAKRFQVDLENLEESKQMPFICTFEKIGLKRGRTEGCAIGHRESLLRVLHKRFGEVPVKIEKKINKLEDPAKLLALMDWAMDAKSLKNFPLK